MLNINNQETGSSIHSRSFLHIWSPLEARCELSAGRLHLNIA